MNYVLQTNCMTAVFDEMAVWQSFRNQNVPYDFISPHGLWRMILGTEQEMEIEILPEYNIPRIEAGPDVIRCTYQQLKSADGRTFPVELIISGNAVGDELRWDAEIINHQDCTVSVREWMFPIVSFSPETEKMTFHSSGGGGQRINNIRSYAQSGFTAYMSWDNLYTRQIDNYPFYLSTNTSCFSNGTETLYLGSHDPMLQKTCHMTELEKYTVLNQLIVKFPFLAPGKKIKYEGYVTAAIQGPWYRAADKYRVWADTWFKQVEHPARVDHSRGWQRIIARTQYGENLYPYHTFPQIYEDGIKSGIDTLFLFGWHKGGHDNDYPNYVPSEALGGEAALKENIRKFRELGGKVILYTNGQLIDTGSEFYRTTGHRISNKNAVGAEPQKFYGFSGRGIAQRVFGNRTFVTACFSTKEWFDVLTGIADQAHEYGCDGVFYDQLGGESYPCCDPNHGHPVPFLQATAVRADMISRLHDYIHTKYPGMSMGIELLTDLTMRYADYVHPACAPLAILRDPAWKEHGGKPELWGDMDWLRYIFPGVRITNREIREEDDLERKVSPSVAPVEFRVNFMIRKNLKSDVEIYRCKSTIAAAPQYQEYLGKANEFRKPFADLLDNAVFLCGSRHTCDNDKVDSDGHLAPDGSIVVLVSQSASGEETARIRVPGMKLEKSAVLNGGQVLPDGTVTLGMHGLAVLVFH